MQAFFVALTPRTGHSIDRGLSGTLATKQYTGQGATHSLSTCQQNPRHAG